MKHKIWKFSFVAALAVTLYWSIGIIGAVIIHLNNPALWGETVVLVCLLFGVAMALFMVLITVCLARQAFRDVKERG